MGGQLRTSGKISSSSTTVESFEFIKNIKKKEEKKDIKYWFDLFERGAITEEEYLEKKKEFL